MPISRTYSFNETAIKVSSGSTQNLSGISIRGADYVLVHVLVWHRTDNNDPVVTGFTLYDSGTPANSVSLTLLNTDNNDTTYTEEGFASILTYGGKANGLIDQPTCSITFTGPIELDNWQIFGSVYSSVDTVGNSDYNSGTGTTQDAGIITPTFIGSYGQAYLVTWEDNTTMTSAGNHDAKATLTSIYANQDIESTPGTKHTMLWSYWTFGPTTSISDIEPTDNTTDTYNVRYFTGLLAVNPMLMDGGMGVLF